MHIQAGKAPARDRPNPLSIALRSIDDQSAFLGVANTPQAVADAALALLEDGAEVGASPTVSCPRCMVKTTFQKGSGLDNWRKHLVKCKAVDKGLVDRIVAAQEAVKQAKVARPAAEHNEDESASPAKKRKGDDLLPKKKKHKKQGNEDERLTKRKGDDKLSKKKKKQKKRDDASDHSDGSSSDGDGSSSESDASSSSNFSYRSDSDSDDDTLRAPPHSSSSGGQYHTLEQGARLAAKPSAGQKKP